MAVEAPRIGLDLVAVPRMREALEGKEERWQRRVFTAREWKSAHEGGNRDVALAVCFAAKEAAFKALGTGWGGGVAWQDVEVRSLAHATLTLSGRAAELASEAGLTLTLSVSHTHELAVAMVVGQR